MKVVIAGDRDVTDRDLVWSIIDQSPFEITEVVCGKARGVDTLGEEWAEAHGIPVKPFPYIRGVGKAGGPMRNKQMADYADALIAIWIRSKSKGTKDMITQAFKGGLHMYVVNLEAL